MERPLVAWVVLMVISSLFFVNAIGDLPVDMNDSNAISDVTQSPPSPNFETSFPLMDQTTAIFVGVFTFMAVGAAFGLIIDGIKRKRKLKIHSPHNSE